MGYEGESMGGGGLHYLGTSQNIIKLLERPVVLSSSNLETRVPHLAVIGEESCTVRLIYFLPLTVLGIFV